MAGVEAHSAVPGAAPDDGPAAPRVLGSLAYLLLLVLLLLLVPAELVDADGRPFLFALGFVAMWRWGWGAVHLGRGLWYRLVNFPEMRAAAAALARQGPAAPAVFVVVTSYRAPTATTVAAFAAALRELAALDVPATLVAAVTDAAEEALIADLRRRVGAERVELVLLRQDGTGKRAALGQGLRAVSRRAPPPDAVVVLMDGDTVVPAGGLRRLLPFFRLRPRLGALTVDTGTAGLRPGWVRDWFELRYAQRHLLMCSLALSRRLLVLTGRLSAYRAAAVTGAAFLDAIERDGIDHWRYGRLPFLTGDDKSAWYHVLRQGWDMLYVPDVRAHTVEAMPSGGFVAASFGLMVRWFGNMLRSNGRALRLGPRRVGLFLWWCLLDQRVSMWTTLAGPVFVLLLSLVFTPAFLLAYALWVAATRLFQAVVFARFAGRRFSPLFPPLLFYNQVMGALTKVYASFRLDRQRWTRQNVAAPAAGDGGWHRLWNWYLHALALSAFLYALALVAGALPVPVGTVAAAVAGAVGG